MNKKTVFFSLMLILLLSIMLVSCATKEQKNVEGAMQESEEQNTKTEGTTEPITETTVEETTEEPAEEPKAQEDDDTGEEVREGEFGKFTVIYKNEAVNATQESGPFKVTINKMQIGTLEVNENYKEIFDNKDLVTVVTLEIEVENKSSGTNSIYPNQGTIVTNTKEQKNADLLLSDDVGGDFIGEVVKKGNVIFLLDSAAEEITSIKYIIEGPHNADFETIGDDIVFELSR